MPRYMQANASRMYICGWKCVHCGHMNAEIGSVRAEAMVGFSFFGRDRNEASRMAKESANKFLSKEEKRTERLVNRRGRFHLLNVSGVCEECRGKQPWKERKLLRAALCVAYFFGFGKAVNVMNRPDFGLPLLLMAAGVLVIWYGGRYVGEKWALMRLRSLGGEECVPLAVFGETPEGIQADDPRMEAVRGLTWKTVVSRLDEQGKMKR